MNNKLIPLEYVNNLVYELEKAFWDERGRGARFRMTTVGRELFQKEILPALGSPELEQIIKVVQDFLQEQGITSRISCEIEGRLLRVRVEGCIHRQVEEKMLARGIEPFTCIPANLVALAIEEKLDRPVELAEVKVSEGACHLLLVLFDHRPTLD